MVAASVTAIGFRAIRKVRKPAAHSKPVSAQLPNATVRGGNLRTSKKSLEIISFKIFDKLGVSTRLELVVLHSFGGR